MKPVKQMITTIIILYLISGVLLYLLQRDFMYFPTDPINHNYNTQTVLSGNIELNNIVLNPGKKSAILYFGGNSETVVHNAANFIKTFPEHTIYLHNYRGYGNSQGIPTEENLYDDSQLLYDTFCLKHQQCSVIGRSLGSGIATYLASTRDIKSMVLVTPYDSIESLAQSQYPIFPISLMLKDKYDSANRVKYINSNTLVILAENDNVIPSSHTQILIDEFKPEKISVSVIKNTDHNNISSSKKYLKLLHDFFY